MTYCNTGLGFLGEYFTWKGFGVSVHRHDCVLVKGAPDEMFHELKHCN